VNDPASVIRRHVEAFNARDLEALIACFSDDASWITGTDSFHGVAALGDLFAAAFAKLSPRLTILTLVAEGDRVACELREDFAVEGSLRIDHIAGFYVVPDGRITAAKIYREGSARV
jgi:hypothetical protein